jgi:hypothetical protein
VSGQRVVVIQNDSEVLIFQYDEGKNAAIGSEEYFTDTGREIEDYDVEVVCLPVEVSPRLNASGSQYPHVEDEVKIA